MVRRRLHLFRQRLDRQMEIGLDMPRVDLELLETREGNACYGANGISHSLANTHPVIMAIHNAIGKWAESPATPDKVLKSLGKG